MAHSLNPEGAQVTHADLRDDGMPLCGWLADDEHATRLVTRITCRDCLAAL